MKNIWLLMMCVFILMSAYAVSASIDVNDLLMLPSTEPASGEANDGNNNICHGNQCFGGQDPDPNVCGDGQIGGWELCELPNTHDNPYCPQATEVCSGYRSATRDELGNCDGRCLCRDDGLNFECVKDQCGAVCDDNSDCDDNDPSTEDSCDIENTCKCGHSDTDSGSNGGSSSPNGSPPNGSPPNRSPPDGVPEFTPFALGLAVVGAGLGLAFLRKH